MRRAAAFPSGFRQRPFPRARPRPRLHRAAVWPAALAIAACTAPLHAAQAEGARLTLDCRVIRYCDAQNQCTDEMTPVEIVFAPLARDADGAGVYTVSINGAVFDAHGASDIGPFQWTDGATDMTLTVLSETAATVLSVSPDGSGNSSLTEMTCGITQ